MSKKTFKIWPDPEEGKPYGPTAKQQLLFIESLPLEDTFIDEINIKRPHLHPVDVVCFIGGARCFGMSTPILMYDGTIKPVQDIQVGDLLMGPDSLPRRVEELCRGQDQMYKVIPSFGDPWICNEDHVLAFKATQEKAKLNNGKKLGEKKYPKNRYINLSIKEYLAKKSTHFDKVYHLYRSECIQFQKSEDLKIDPYILGYWLGDGNSANTRITTIDEESVLAFDKFCEEKGLVFSRGVDGIHYSVISPKQGGTNNPFLDQLRFYNLINNKHIPNVYFKGTEEERLKLLAGLLDSDGSLVEKDGRTFEFSQKDKKLADQVAFLARSLGFRSLVNFHSHFDKRYKKIRESYKISITGDIDNIPVKINRKQKKLNTKKRIVDQLVTGFKLEPLGLGDFYGFLISGSDQLFLLGDFTVVHNSGKTCSATARSNTISY